MTLEELEFIEQAAQRGEASPATVLQLTAYLRNVLQMKTNAESLLDAYCRKENIIATSDHRRRDQATPVRRQCR